MPGSQLADGAEHGTHVAGGSNVAMCTLRSRIVLEHDDVQVTVASGRPVPLHRLRHLVRRPIGTRG
jgi:hypothetical protein